jgi:hypothetical protein
MNEFEEWAQSTVDSLRRLGKLPWNWDGYNSPPLTRYALRTAHTFVTSTAHLALPEPEVVPVSGGGVNLVFAGSAAEIEFEFLPDGSTVVCGTLPTFGEEADFEAEMPNLAYAEQLIRSVLGI